MAMTKKDFELVAKALREQRRHFHQKFNMEMEAMDHMTQTMAAYFALMYDNFKKDQFLEAAKFGEDPDD